MNEARLSQKIWRLGVILLLTGCGRVFTPTPELNTVAAPTPVVAAQATTTPVISATPTATATPRLVTPIATATPTVTPTPIIYAVQAGDTLLSIAIQFDTTTETIQEVNGIVDPRFLQIGQPLIIPTPQVDPQTPPTATPVPPPLDVTAINFQPTKQGTLWCLGEVNNPNKLPIAEVVIEASLLDVNGVVLAREAAYTQLDVIQSGQTAPFAILFDDPPASFGQYQVVAVSGIPLAGDSRFYFDLEAFATRGAPEGLATYRIEGQLRNAGTFDAEKIRLVTVAYDRDKRILAQRQVDLAVNVLKTGAVTPFDVELIIPSGSVEYFKVLAQGLKLE
jgi:LysM repeat protein